MGVDEVLGEPSATATKMVGGDWQPVTAMDPVDIRQPF